MKMMVCGKGGSGKSVVSVLMARALAKERKVLLIDSDESNILLPKLLGVEPPKPLAEYLGDKKSVFRREGADVIKALGGTGEGVKLGGLPPECVSTSSEGVKLVTVGKVRSFGEGCACPFNYLTKLLLRNLVLDEKEVVLVDTDAGIEHLGRGVEEECDAILAVADPTAEALVLARGLKEFSQGHSKRFWLVLNKATPKVAEQVEKRAREMGLEVDGVIGFDEEVFESCLEGGALHAGRASRDVEAILKKIGLLEGSK